MKPRDLFILALRVVGIWTLVNALGTLPVAAYTAYQATEAMRAEDAAQVPSAASLATLWAGPVFYALASCVLLLLAPRIASLFYGREEQDVTPAVSLSRSDMLAVGLGLLGIYACLLAVPPVADVVAYTAKDVPFSLLTHYEFVTVVEAALYLGSGCVLIVSAQRIARSGGRTTTSEH
jgi:hypothetical protein